MAICVHEELTIRVVHSFELQKALSMFDLIGIGEVILHAISGAAQHDPIRV